jgi:hypothetical protein
MTVADSSLAVTQTNKNEPDGVLGRLKKKHDQGKALSIQAHQLGREVYDMLKRQTAFDLDLFLQA